MGKKKTSSKSEKSGCTGKALLMILALAFFPITLLILVLKSNLKPKAKIGIIGGSIGLCVISAIFAPSGNNNQAPEIDRSIPVIETTVVTTTENQVTTITSETTITTAVTTVELSDNPLLNAKLTKADTGYGTNYGFIRMQKSSMSDITTAQLREYVQKYGPELTWLSIKFNDGTGLFISTMKSASITFAKYGELDEQGAINKGIGSIGFDEENFKIYCGDDDNFEQTDKNAFDIEFFEKMSGVTESVESVQESETEPVTEYIAPEPEPESEPEPEYVPEVQRTTGQVYIAASGKGKKYHYDPYCSNMNNEVIAMSREEAEAQGYTMCGRE